MEQIQVKGIESLDEKEKKIADKLFGEYFTKLQRKIKNTLSLKIYVKEYNKEGKRKKYSINAEAVSSGKTFKANSHEWDFATTIHQVFEKILTQVEHEFHVSDQH
ncbi:MAG: hypothetical protein AABX91_03270 [Nanoarchaeota archaeon]